MLETPGFATTLNRINALCAERHWYFRLEVQRVDTTQWIPGLCWPYAVPPRQVPCSILPYSSEEVQGWLWGFEMALGLMPWTASTTRENK